MITSESRNRITSPVAVSTPRFLAAAGPVFAGHWTTLTPAALAMAAVESVEPSSTRTTSKGGTDCAAIDSRHLGRVFPALKAGITTEILVESSEMSASLFLHRAAARAAGITTPVE
jgi:hypothetical protein